MSINVTCSGCKSKFKAPGKLAGNQCRCPKCKTLIQIPMEKAGGQIPPPEIPASVPTEPFKPVFESALAEMVVHGTVQPPTVTQEIVVPPQLPQRRRVNVPVKVALIGGPIGLIALILLLVAFLKPDATSTIGFGFAPTIDGSSEETFQKSIAHMKEPLVADDRTKLEKALMAIAFAELGQSFAQGGLFGAAADTEGVQSRLRDRLNGKSASEIIAEADELTASRAHQQRAQIISEIKELELKIANAKEAQKKLADFVVERSRFYREEERFTDSLIIELTVTNNTSYAVSRAFFHGVLSSPGRSVPWVEDDFNYEISGGLEPGESTTWRLSPNQFGEWGKTPADRNDMVLTVTVVRIDGADGKPIIDADLSRGMFDTQSPEERLEALKESLENLR